MTVSLSTLALMPLFVILGSTNTIVDKIRLTEKSLNLDFHHIWFLDVLMFTSESLSIVFYFICLKFKKEILYENNNGNRDENKKTLPKLLMMLPPLFDISSASLLTFGLLLVNASIYQMFRGSLIIFTFLLSIFYLKNRHYFFHYIGIVIVILGLCMVGLANHFLNKNSEEIHKGIFSFFGIFLIILSQMFTSFQIIAEEKIVKGYNTHPLEIIGWEGIWGALYSLFFIIVFYFIKCSNPSEVKGEYYPSLVREFCNSDEEDIWRVENIFFALKQLKANKIILIMSIISFISIPIYNVTGVFICKKMTGAARAVVDSLRTLVVWVFFLTGINPPTTEKFSIYQLGGFILILIGVLIYNDISGLFSKYLEKNKEENLSDSNEEEDKMSITTKKSKSSPTKEEEEEALIK